MDPGIRLFTASMILSMLHLSILRPSESKSCRDLQQEGFIQYDTSCSNNCSQTDYSVEGDRTFLDCSVGLPTDFNGFITRHQVNEDNSVFEAPTLQWISFYWKRFPDANKEASLNFTFRLPKGIISPRFELPQAVFLEFQSVKDSQYSDQYYYECPVQRVFRFRSIRPSLTIDIQNPWNISYDCVVGLDQTKPVLAYNLSLQTFRGPRTDYILTVPMRSWKENDDVWRPVIATQYDAVGETVQVIIEEEPDWIQADGPHVTLIDVESGTHTIGRPKKSGNHIVFDEIKYGRHYINVTYNKCVKCGMTSYIIEAQVPMEPTFISTELLQMVIVVSVAGCVVVAGVIILIVYICIRRKHHKTRRTPKFETDSMQDEMSDQQLVTEDDKSSLHHENLKNDINDNERDQAVSACPLLHYSKSSGTKTDCCCHLKVKDEARKKIERTLKCENSQTVSLPHGEHHEEYVYAGNSNVQGKRNKLLIPENNMCSSDMFTISIESSLWDSGSDLCCGGRHEPVTYKPERSQSLSDLGKRTACFDFSLVPAHMNKMSSNKQAEETKNLNNILATMRMLNCSNENL